MKSLLLAIVLILPLTGFANKDSDFDERLSRLEKTFEKVQMKEKIFKRIAMDSNGTTVILSEIENEIHLTKVRLDQSNDGLKLARERADAGTYNALAPKQLALSSKLASLQQELDTALEMFQ